MMARIVKEVWVGGILHTNGVGLNYSAAKFKTYKKKSLINVDLVNETLYFEGIKDSFIKN